MLLSNKCIQFLCTHSHQDNTQKSAHLLPCFYIQLLILPIKCLTAKVKRGWNFLSPFLKMPGKIPNSWSSWWNVCSRLLCLNITCLVSKVTQINQSPSLRKCNVPQPSSLLLAPTASIICKNKRLSSFSAECTLSLCLLTMFLILSATAKTSKLNTQVHAFTHTLPVN